MEWNNPSCAITTYYRDSGGTETPEEVRLFHRAAGTSTWTDGGLMTSAGSYRYTYNFTNKYPSGTSVQWMVRIKRAGLSVYSYSFAPAKYD